MTEDKDMGAGGDGTGGDAGGYGDPGTEGFGGSSFAGGGTGYGAAAGEFGGGVGDVGGGPSSAGVIAPVSAQVVDPNAGQSTKVTEGKAAVKRSARRRSLLGGEEGGLTPVGIYRRSILGS